MFTIMVASLVLGLALARLNVFAALVGAFVCAASSFIYDISRDATLAHMLLASFLAAFALQVGYLVGQFLRRPQE